MFEEPLNVAEMERAADMLVGTHDFRNFCTLDTNNFMSRLRRTIDVCRLEEVPVPMHGTWRARCLVLNIKGKGFLYN